MDLHSMIFLAWPVIAIAYPIYLTVRTIETGLIYDMRKVATYWTIFSFIYVFEYVFYKLLEWVPLWPYLRLVFMCWLVMPQLNGASYLYQNLVYPYWQFKLHHAFTQFCATCSKWFENLNKDSHFKLEENGSATLENLIASKVENKTSSALQVISKPAIPKLPDTSSSSLPLLHNRWTCEICEVRVSSELTLQSHIRGKRHRAEAKLWCDFCNLRVSGEIDMIAHLKGKRHLAKVQAFASAGAL
ncbi:HVA22-like protein c [Capsicum galapagoense]